MNWRHHHHPQPEPQPCDCAPQVVVVTVTITDQAGNVRAVRNTHYLRRVHKHHGYRVDDLTD